MPTSASWCSTSIERAIGHRADSPTAATCAPWRHVHTRDLHHTPRRLGAAATQPAGELRPVSARCRGRSLPAAASGGADRSTLYQGCLRDSDTAWTLPRSSSGSPVAPTRAAATRRCSSPTSRWKWLGPRRSARGASPACTASPRRSPGRNRVACGVVRSSSTGSRWPRAPPRPPPAHPAGAARRQRDPRRRITPHPATVQPQRG